MAQIDPLLPDATGRYLSAVEVQTLGTGTAVTCHSYHTFAQARAKARTRDA